MLSHNSHREEYNDILSLGTQGKDSPVEMGTRKIEKCDKKPVNRIQLRTEPLRQGKVGSCILAHWE